MPNMNTFQQSKAKRVYTVDIRPEKISDKIITIESKLGDGVIKRNINGNCKRIPAAGYRQHHSLPSGRKTPQKETCHTQDVGWLNAVAAG